MVRFTRTVAAVGLTALVGAGLAACSDNEQEPAPAASGTAGIDMTTTTPSTTMSSTVPGPADPVGVPAAVAERWTALAESGVDLGVATGPAEDVDEGSITEFERGSLVLTPAGQVFLVQGEILSAYLESGGPGGDLGFPTSDEATTDGGWISTFDGGVITYLDGVAEVEVN
ncbi:MAG TPA: hypothetical protein H9878_08015 [Candidatus Dietzia merdigallinarum]|nr:hypothetical protein [Candidatus Dietzia merdigallinarum]